MVYTLTRKFDRLEQQGRPRLTSLVMEPSLEHDDVVTVNQIDESVFLVDPPRPGASKNVPQWLGLANPVSGISNRVSEQAIQSLKNLLVACLPVAVVLPPVRSEDQPTQARS